MSSHPHVQAAPPGVVAPQRPVLKIVARASIWNNTLPRARRALFCDSWAGGGLRKDRFRARRHTDLAEILAALGVVLTPLAP
ncbi:hypothetical protein ACFC09_14770 [Streptomyces sp. NPDC056161]|uniref:hypothetical protein n=1 Tax=Streptomyces sp. NPDC056161 TaxID=3345732 RepID=UPI0035DACC15